MKRFNTIYELEKVPKFPSKILKYPIPSAFYTKLDDSYIYLNELKTIYQDDAAIWYSLKEPKINPLSTPYATAREEQVYYIEDMPPTVLAFSVKNKQRQYPDEADQVFYDGFQLIMGMMKGNSISRFTKDINLFPLIPTIDMFECARLLENLHIEDLEQKVLKSVRAYFLRNNNLTLANENLKLYPPYYLFFLMTRFACYPFSERQVELSLIRGHPDTTFKTRILIDVLFDLEEGNDADLFLLVSHSNNGTGKDFLDTDYDNWTRWGNEYFKCMNSPILQDSMETIIDKILNTKSLENLVSTNLQYLTDRQIDQLLSYCEMEDLIKDEYHYRREYLLTLVTLIKKKLQKK